MKTVGDIIAALQQYPADTPAVVSTAYDNDIGLTDQFEIFATKISHSEDQFYHIDDDPKYGSPQAKDVVAIFGG